MKFESNPNFDGMGLETPEDDLLVLNDLSRETSRMFRDCRSPHEYWEALEVGTWAGRTALVLADHFQHVYCVDHWEGNLGDDLGKIAAATTPIATFRTFCRNMGDKLFRQVTPCFGSSSFYASVWPNTSLALVFIDGDHRYEAVKSDIAAWLPKVIPGGIICGHDYSQGFDGVVQAVCEAFPGTDLDNRHRCRSRVWWHHVPD